MRPGDSIVADQQSLIEREIRQAMEQKGIDKLSLYPEERFCHKPTARRIFQLFSDAECCTLFKDGEVVQVFDPPLTEIQTKVLDLLGVPNSAYISAE